MAFLRDESGSGTAEALEALERGAPSAAAEAPEAEWGEAVRYIRALGVRALGD